MEIHATNKKTFVVFQPYQGPVIKTRYGRTRQKVGFISENSDLEVACNDVIACVVNHCKQTGLQPSAIFKREAA